MNFYKKILFSLLVSFICIIFIEALIPGELSKKQSDAVGDIVSDIIESNNKDNNNSNIEDNNIIGDDTNISTIRDSKFYYFIRKLLGHFGVFFILGIISVLYFSCVFKIKEFGYICSLILGFLVGLISELLQLIPSGRYCSFDDVLTDFFGFVISSSVIILIIVPINKICNKRRLKNV